MEVMLAELGKTKRTSDSIILNCGCLGADLFLAKSACIKQRMENVQAIHTFLVNPESMCSCIRDMKIPRKSKNKGRLENILNFECILSPPPPHTYSKRRQSLTDSLFEHNVCPIIG